MYVGSWYVTVTPPRVSLRVPRQTAGFGGFTLRLPLGGVTVTYQDPTYTLYPYTWSRPHLKGIFPKYLENEDNGRKKST